MSDDNNNVHFQQMDDSADNEKDFYKVFKERLNDVQGFPSDYIFKFIYPSGEETMEAIKAIFANANPAYEYKASKNRKYTSISVTIYAIDADQVIQFYKDISEIKDVIML